MAASQRAAYIPLLVRALALAGATALPGELQASPPSSLASLPPLTPAPSRRGWRSTCRGGEALPALNVSHASRASRPAQGGGRAQGGRAQRGRASLFASPAPRSGAALAALLAEELSEDISPQVLALMASMEEDAWRLEGGGASSTAVGVWGADPRSAASATRSLRLAAGWISFLDASGGMQVHFFRSLEARPMEARARPPPQFEDLGWSVRE
jgi:hypothetical protein